MFISFYHLSRFTAHIHVVAYKTLENGGNGTSDAEPRAFHLSDRSQCPGYGLMTQGVALTRYITGFTHAQLTLIYCRVYGRPSCNSGEE